MAVHQAGREVHGPTSQSALAKCLPQPSAAVSQCHSSVVVRTAVPSPPPPWFIDKVLPNLLTGVVIALVGSLLLAGVMERYRGRREHLNKAVDALRAQLVALQKTSATYWSTPYSQSKSPPLEAELEYLLQDIASLMTLCAPSLWHRGGRGPEALTDLAAAVTGDGMLGSKERKADHTKIQEITGRAAALSKLLAGARRDYLFRPGWWSPMRWWDVVKSDWVK